MALDISENAKYRNPMELGLMEDFERCCNGYLEKNRDGVNT